MVKINSTLFARAAVFGLAVCAASSAQAGEIELTLVGSDIAISGEFIRFSDQAYTIETSSGELNIPAKYVTCEGVDCLDFFDTVNQASG